MTEVYAQDHSSVGCNPNSITEYACPFLFSLEELATFPLFTCITMTRQYPAWYQDYTQCMDLVPDGRWSLRHADEGNTIVH